MSLSQVFLTALMMGFSHCLTMCGGIVLAYSQSKFSHHNILQRFFLHLTYNFGRLSSYVLIGVVFGFLGQAISLNSVVSGYSLVFLGIFICAFALSFAFFPKIIAFFEPNVAKIPFFSKIFFYSMKSRAPLSFYFLGVLNGFLPCGMVYFFATLSLASGDLIDGILVMLSFGIATIIPLMIVSIAFEYLRNLRKIFLYLGCFGMLLLGGMNIYKGLKMIIAPQNHTHHMHMMQTHQHHHMMHEEEEE